MSELLTGIELDDNLSFRAWAENMLPWLREAMFDVAEGIGGDIATLIDKQQRYTAYAGALTEIYAKAEAYKTTALAEAMEKQIKKGIPASLVARVAEGEIKNETRVFEAIHRLNSTLSDQLIAISSRLKYETAVMPSPGRRNQ
jgi:hypothetical protein